MLRAIAVLLVSLLGFGMMAPAMSAYTGAELPACCRTHGKHKCEMRHPSSAIDGQSAAFLHSIREKCPFSSDGGFIAVAPLGFFPAGVSAQRGLFAPEPNRVAEAEARYRVSFSRTRQKRGPPAFLS